MPDIIFHIGLPKCASTTLQNQVFKNELGYLGTNKDRPYSQNFAKQLQHDISPVGPRLFSNMRRAKQWVENVRADYASAPQYILSSEMFANRNKISNRPIIPFLKKFKEELWSFGNVKVILVIRNQAERAASDYAQVSSGRVGASQRDFEQSVMKVIQKDAQSYDYSSWVGELSDALGKENVCVLLMEDIKFPRFWNELKTFAGLANFHPTDMLSNAPTNTRRIKSNTWQLRPLDLDHKAKTLANNVFRVFWPSPILPKLRQPILQLAKNTIKIYYTNSPKLKHEQHRGTHIELTPELRQKIQEACKPYNDELAILLDRDISALGY